MDVGTAFLHRDLQEKVLTEQPDYFAVANECVLYKFIYRAKQVAQNLQQQTY